MSISLSILEYESELSRLLERIEEARSFKRILLLVKSGMLKSLHVDVMRPDLIRGETRFPLILIKRLYENFIDMIPFQIHLMMKVPIDLIDKLNMFIAEERRDKVSLVLQREVFKSERKILCNLNFIRNLGYKAGLGLDLPSSLKNLTKTLIANVDYVLLMTVPMGKGGQKYSPQATFKIARFSKCFPEKEIEVDGGINEKTILEAKRAGAKTFVVGSYITRNKNPLRALKKLRNVIGKNHI
ncbi:TPA: hypothetical protein EYP70_08115 [Candidatus Bathyarchaeota archaeon]|nr:hypothetical protein [Candidatus Bathyarchaeota archaeon]